MKEILSNISITVNNHIYLKNPESSGLGKRILEGSIDLLDELGFEAFTFKRLADRISSTEASVYRYFESKHKLLLYLTSWYWAWTDFRLFISLANIPSPEERLKRAINLLTSPVQKDISITHINEEKLHRIVIAESSKSYLTKEVDEENEEGVFYNYKKLVQRVCDIIFEIDPKYKYPHMLISTVIEGSHHQRFFAEHLPRLTDTSKKEDAIVFFYTDMVFQSLRAKQDKKLKS
ncbi:MAG TPA: TetR family transcriptional regulator [Flavobacteriales bacterium]|nr:TetR family transcriptional regulator [Flavobacteriales bacterium]